MSKQPPTLRILSAQSYVAEAARAIAADISALMRERATCRVALSGGSTPQPIYAALVQHKEVAWDRVRFFFGDERAVDPDDEHSNYRMVRETLLDPLCVRAEHVFRIAGERPAAEARDLYAAVLGEKAIDLMLLGMGGDGHTASLFPGGTLDPTSSARVLVTHSPVPPTVRISLSLRAINEAEQVTLLVAGAAKASRLAEVWHQLHADAPVLPAAWVQPHSGRLQWIIDRDAAAALPKEY